MSLTDHQLTAARIIRETWLIDFRPDTLRVTPQGRVYEAIVRALGEAAGQVGAAVPPADLETIRDANQMIELCLHQIQGIESRYPDGVVEGGSGGRIPIGPLLPWPG